MEEVTFNFGPVGIGSKCQHEGCTTLLSRARHNCCGIVKHVLEVGPGPRMISTKEYYTCNVVD
ncbi:unnamed protein product [Meloidogyne enterolobii]|uniref:Uncharacterized protein n=1 Tax=Meloidogyne enterolobii TaxID=390850 RepID=A0ACB0YAM9_MELEN